MPDVLEATAAGVGEIGFPESLPVHQEALAALRLFAEAAAKEEATAELARRVVEYLAKARCQPELRFEAS